MGLFSSKTKTKSQVTPLRSQHVYGWADRMWDLSQRPREFFPGQTYAGMDPLQQEAMGEQERYAREGVSGILDPTLEAWQTTLTAPDVARNPYVQDMLEQQRGLLSRNLQEGILPGIQTGAIGAGQLGSSRQGVAEGLAARGTQEALGRTAAQTQLGAYGQGLTQQRFGIGAAPSLMAAGAIPGETLARLGAARRAEEQRGITEAMQRHEFAQEEPWARQERFARSYFPYTQPYAATSSTTKGTPSTLGAIGQFAGLGTSLLGMGAGAGMFGGGGASQGILSGAFAPGGLVPGGGYGRALAAPSGYMAPSPGGFMPMGGFGFRGY